jgi:hypothetical protein
MFGERKETMTGKVFYLATIGKLGHERGVSEQGSRTFHRHVPGSALLPTAACNVPHTTLHHRARGRKNLSFLKAKSLVGESESFPDT